MGVTYSSQSTSKLNAGHRKGSVRSICEIDKHSDANDMNIYFVLQIAKSLRDYDLEQKIDLEIKMREGTTKLLAACKHPVQSLEASKSLMTSNQRMTAYVSELQKRKVREKLESDIKKCHVKVDASKARVAVSDIRIPLIWKDSDHFKNKGDYRRFAVFCLLKIGTEIYDTALINNIDRTVTDVSFDDIVVFHHIPCNFELKLEVYCKVLHDDLSIASTPKKIKKKISSSVSRTFGRKMAASLKDEFSENGPKFDLIAEATLKLNDASDSIRTHDLVIDAENRQSALPLFGHFCCRLAVNPDCIHEERVSNYLRVAEFSGKNIPKDVPLYWASLRNFGLFLWRKRREEVLDMKTEEANIVIPITERVRVNLVNSCTFTIETNESKTYSLSVINEQDLQLWVAHIKQHSQDYISWGNAAKNVMDIPSPSPNRVHMFLRQRAPGSLYDETPLSDLSSKLSTSLSCRGVSPTAVVRSRSSSMSSSETCSTSTNNSNSLEHYFKYRPSSKYLDSQFTLPRKASQKVTLYKAFNF